MRNVNKDFLVAPLLWGRDIYILEAIYKPGTIIEVIYFKRFLELRMIFVRDY